MLLKSGEKVSVEWLDACSLDEWTERSEVESMTPAPVETSGIVVHHDQNNITIAGNYDPENDLFSCVMCIPTGMVTKVKRLR